MSVTSSIPKLVNGKILRDEENKLIAKRICTMDPDAEIKKYGDTVYFTGLVDPTVNTYSGTINYEDLQDGSISLLINQQEYVAFKIDDIEAFQSKVDIKGSQTERASYELLNKQDAYVFGLYAEAGQTIAETVTSANILSVIARAAKLMTKVNVYPGDRWMTVSPGIKQKLMLAGIKFQINDGVTSGYEGGYEYAAYQGFDIWETNNVVTSGDEETENAKCLCGSYNAIAFANQIMKSRFIPALENSFSGGFSALCVYGAKVIKPKELLLLNLTEAAETTI